MFAEFLNKLVKTSPDPLEDEDARLALTALLVRVARTDGDYAPAEKARIDLISMDRYNLAAGDAAQLRTQAEILEAEAPDTVVFTESIKRAVAYENRLGVVEALWQVALADGQREAGEDSLLRVVSKFLGVSDIDSARARQRIAKNT